MDEETARERVDSAALFEVERLRIGAAIRGVKNPSAAEAVAAPRLLPFVFNPYLFCATWVDCWIDKGWNV